MSEALSPADRRARVRAYKEAFPPMGVYAVRCTASGRVWLGSSRDAEAALNRIRFQLKMRGHRHAQLSAEWNLHGPDHFVFEVVERLRKREDPAFDYAAELQTSLELWLAELGGERA